MAFEFCFTPLRETGSYHATFQSVDGVKYVLKCHFNSITPDGHLTLQWDHESSKFVRISCYSENNKHQFSETSLLVKDKVAASLPFKYTNNSVIVVSVAPRVKFSERQRNPLVAGPVDPVKTHSRKIPFAKTDFQQLSLDMKSLLQTGEFSDVVLTDGSSEILAHKLILSARSSVFSRMLQNPMRESRENRITVKDISIETLKELLHFMYTGSITLKDWQMAVDLYVAADKYDVKGLGDICLGVLKSVELGNVLDTLLLADFYNNKVLKDAALDFASKNFSQLKVLPTWGNFMKENQTLAIEILNFVIDKNNTN